MARMLTGPELWVLYRGIEAAFVQASLERVVRFRLGRRLDNYSMANDFPSVIYGLIDGANRESWWPDLLIAARDANPRNPVLIEAEAELLATAREDQGNLEKVVNLRSLFQDVVDFGRHHGRIVASVCAIEDSQGGLGTGWLVAADLVITNYHVVKRYLDGAPHQGLRCRFDFKIVDGVARAGREVRLAEKWCVAHRPFSKSDIVAGAEEWRLDELDYAVLRLAEPIGNQPLGENPEPGASLRGWVTMPSAAPAMAEGDMLWVYQHPQDLPSRRLQPMKLSNGVVKGWVGKGIRLRHDARTLPGSSGSLCCDSELRVIALHHAGDPQDWPDYRGSYNQAIPIERIVADLIVQSAQVKSDIPAFWDREPLDTKAVI